MKKYLKTGVGLIGATTFVGVVPNLTGSAAETTLRSDFSTGMGHMGKALPVMGKVKGTQMVMKSVKKLKPIKIKGAYKI